MTHTERRALRVFDKSIDDLGCPWGIHPRMVTVNSFCRSPLRISDFLNHLRNSLSHPMTAPQPSELPTTGYTTLPDGTGVISRYQFTTSPDITPASESP